MSELIRREDAINAVEMFFKDAYIEDADVHCTDMVYEIDHIPAAPRWHRVEEPPKKTAKYLVWVDVNNGAFAAYPELRTAAYNIVYERWYVDGDQRTEWIGTPRYWAPLPEPPMEDV